MERCSERVSTDSWHYSQCSRKAVVERDGKPYCKIHDPEYIKAKSEEHARKYNANSCKKCRFHFDRYYYVYCPLCGTKRLALTK